MELLLANLWQNSSLQETDASIVLIASLILSLAFWYSPLSPNLSACWTRHERLRLHLYHTHNSVLYYFLQSVTTHIHTNTNCNKTYRSHWIGTQHSILLFVYIIIRLSNNNKKRNKIQEFQNAQRITNLHIVTMCSNMKCNNKSKPN